MRVPFECCYQILDMVVGGRCRCEVDIIGGLVLRESRKREDRNKKTTTVGIAEQLGATSF
jgi:hypothetical protein